MLNLHRLFFHHFADDCYLSQLTLAEPTLTMLRDARKKIRATLRDGISAASQQLNPGEALTPRFFTQGSLSYGTLNRPTVVPPQQADVDDGCYLPISFLRGERPKRSAQWFFAVADALLKALVAKEGWLDYSVDKTCCCRVIIDREHHIDVPLYAIRDEAFQELVKSARARGYAALREAFHQDATVDISWTTLAHEEVLIADRDGTWKPSDPREVKAWATGIFTAPGGEQLRRVSRYLKGWRDQQYKQGGPSSILLMVLASGGFTACAGRDDLALLEVCKKLPHQLLQDVHAPWGDKTEQINRLSSEARQGAMQLATTLQSEMHKAVEADIASKASVVGSLAAQFGRHFPRDAALISDSSPRNTVTSYPAVAIPTSAFPRTTRAG